MLFVLTAAAPAGANPGAEIETRFQAQIRPFLQKHCFNCHGNGKSKGELTLDRFTSLSAVQDEEKTWRLLADHVRQGAMPPDTRPRPEPAEVDALVEWVGDALARWECTGER